MKDRIKWLLSRCASSQPVRSLVVHLVYPTIARCLIAECQPDVMSRSGVVEQFAWKAHSYQVLSTELASGVNCCPEKLACTWDSRDRMFAVIMDCLKGVQGDIFEFGVSSGKSFLWFLKQCPDRHVYGFDSFEGLPESWWTRPKGAFKADAPVFREPNGTLVKGWFEESLPGFFENYRNPVALVHIDCDIYSASIYALRHVLPLCGPGTVVLFDEYFNYPSFAEHEYLAWHQAQTLFTMHSECIAYDGRRAAFRIV
jgi:hypothetical protein